MTTLDSLGSADPEPAEVSDAALAMADYDAKAGDYAMALDWLAVAALFRGLTSEYLRKKALGSCHCGPAAPPLHDGAGAARRDAPAAVEPPIERERRARRLRGRLPRRDP